MSHADEVRHQEIVLRRLKGMKLEARILPGGRCVAARLPLARAPFETPWGVLELRSLTFGTLGTEQAKCLSPRPLFYLPILPLLQCSSPSEMEARVRTAWRARIAALERVKQWLEKLGATPQITPRVPFVRFAIDAEDGAARAAAIEPGRLILPGRGPLSGIALERAEDRVFAADAGCGSAIELEIAITNRLEELARAQMRLARERRMREVAHAHAPPMRPAGRRLLLVGPKLGADNALIESLRLRGYRVSVARAAGDALRCFQEASYELILTDTQLDRSDGLELIPALRAVSGLEEIPVVIVDDHRRAERREAARRMGAVGYLVRPIDIAKIESGMAQLVRSPRLRRFTRYPRRLAVHWPGSRKPGVTSTLGRGGMLMWSDADAVVQRVDRYAITLPEIGQKLRVDAELAYRIHAVGATRVGFGLRFMAFPDGNEDALIGLLQGLEAAPATS